MWPIKLSEKQVKLLAYVTIENELRESRDDSPILAEGQFLLISFASMK